MVLGGGACDFRGWIKMNKVHACDTKAQRMLTVSLAKVAEEEGACSPCFVALCLRFLRVLKRRSRKALWRASLLWDGWEWPEDDDAEAVALRSELQEDNGTTAFRSLW
jgi:hypothetical protein